MPAPISPTEIGPILRDARESRGFTQCQMAARYNLPQSALSEYESGRRTPQSLALWMRLADAYGLALWIDADGVRLYCPPSKPPA